MMSLPELTVFISTIFVISISPGLCMSLALSCGITVGFRRTVYMMMGELLGVGSVTLAAIFGIAVIIQQFNDVFVWIKFLGAGYLVYTAVDTWKNAGLNVPSVDNEALQISNSSLFLRGLVTAISNPKGWVFSASFIPAFIDSQSPLLPQTAVILGIFLLSELLCMCLYASGGQLLRQSINETKHFVIVNRLAASLLLVVAMMLVLA